MKLIYKYDLTVGTNVVKMPANSVVLSVQAQGNRPVLYALVREDKLSTSVARRFHVVMTGQLIEDLDCSGFIGTVMLESGTFVVHVFEVQS